MDRIILYLVHAFVFNKFERSNNVIWHIDHKQLVERLMEVSGKSYGFIRIQCELATPSDLVKRLLHHPDRPATMQAMRTILTSWYTRDSIRLA